MFFLLKFLYNILCFYLCIVNNIILLKLILLIHRLNNKTLKYYIVNINKIKKEYLKSMRSKQNLCVFIFIKF